METSFKEILQITFIKNIERVEYIKVYESICISITIIVIKIFILCRIIELPKNDQTASFLRKLFCIPYHPLVCYVLSRQVRQ